MLRIALMSLRNRVRPVALVLAAITVTVFLFVGVQRTREVSRSSFGRTVSGTDIILGARTGQLNLVLYSVFHIGNATANVSYEAFERFADRDDVSWAVPLSLGDSHRGYRVVGTTADYFNHYSYGYDERLQLAAGTEFVELFDVVLGAQVARDLGYDLGDSVVVAHGEGRVGLNLHDDLPFAVSGILGPTGTPVDRSLFVSVEAITAIHVGWETGVRRRSVGAQELETRDLTPDSITAALIGLSSPTAAFQFQRAVNSFEGEPLLAILPGQALFELWQLMGVAELALTVISVAVLAVGLLSLVSTQLAVLDSRRREMALLRSLGATPFQLAFILFVESFLITLIGCVLGIGLLYVVQGALRAPLSVMGFFMEITPPSVTEILLVLGVLAAGSLAGIVPSVGTYRRSLHDGLTVRG